jgi:hypothetical protein
MWIAGVGRNLARAALGPPITARLEICPCRHSSRQDDAVSGTEVRQPRQCEGRHPREKSSSPQAGPVDDLPRCVILNSSLPRWSPLSLFCFCVSDSMLSAASLLCSSWAAWRSLQAWLASSRFSGGRDGFLVAILSFAICMPSLVST